MTWKQSRSGLAIDLVQPDLSKIDLHVDVAVPLSLINRFDGHASVSEWHGYSVAEALDCLTLDPLGRPVSGLVRGAIKGMKQRLDKALYARLGLDWPLLPRTAALVAEMDIRMLKAERDAMMAPPPAPWHDAVEGAARIASLSWRSFHPRRPDEWAAEWLARLAAWHPTQQAAVFGDSVTFIGERAP